MNVRGLLILSRVIAILILSGWASQAAAQAIPAPEQTAPFAPVAITTQTTPQFPTGIQFAARIPVGSNVEIDRGVLYYRIGTDETLNLVAVPAEELAREGDAMGVSVFVNLQAAYVPVGVSLSWYWELSSGDTLALTTLEESTLWMDDRFQWSLRSSEQVSLYTYDASDGFAAWMLQATQATIDDLEARYQLHHIPPVTIWIYPDSESFSGTRQINTREAIAGISYPGASVVAAVVRDGDEREYGRVIPHEISHQVLFHATLNPFAAPPVWLDEGLATQYQWSGNEHYAEVVHGAWQSGALFDITSLNRSFPFGSAEASLAYAASWSMLEYLESAYGAEGVARLIDAFGEGLSVDEAVRAAFGISSTELNEAWHLWVGEQGLHNAAAA